MLLWIWINQHIFGCTFFFFIHKCMAFSNVGNLVETTFTKNANKNNQIWYAYSIPIVKVRLGSSFSLSVFSASGAWCLYVLLNSERESWRDMEQLRIMIDIFNMLYTVKCYCDNFNKQLKMYWCTRPSLSTELI